MRKLADEGMTMLVVTHEMGFAREVADRVVFIDGGRSSRRVRPAQVLEHPPTSERAVPRARDQPVGADGSVEAHGPQDVGKRGNHARVEGPELGIERRRPRRTASCTRPL